MTPHFFAQQKEKWETKEKKERVLKQELLKVCHQGQNVTFLGILRCLEFKKSFFWSTMGPDNSFQCSMPLHFRQPLKS